MSVDDLDARDGPGLPAGMEFICELDKESIIEQIASAKVTNSLQTGDNDLMELRGFEMIFRQICRTPKMIRLLLHREHDFEGQVDFTLSPGTETAMLSQPWFSRSFVVPNYANMVAWIEKAEEEYLAGRTVVMLIPARTNTCWFHEKVLRFATEIRFLRGRITFPGFRSQAPLPDLIVTFKPTARSRSACPTRTDARVLRPRSKVVVVSSMTEGSHVEQQRDEAESDEDEQQQELQEQQEQQEAGQADRGSAPPRPVVKLSRRGRPPGTSRPKFGAEESAIAGQARPKSQLYEKRRKTDSNKK